VGVDPRSPVVTVALLVAVPATRQSGDAVQSVLLWSGAALGWLLLNDPQSFLVRGLLVAAAFLLLAALLTRWVTLSLHVAFVVRFVAWEPCGPGSLIGLARLRS
jgi:hypothetical protein